MKNYFDLKDQVAVVTGASTGLGVQMAKALASQGANIVCVARRQNLIDEVAAEIAKEYGVKAIGVRCDITDTDNVNAAVDQIMEEFGRIDILINNAGGGSGKGECNFLERDPEALKNMIDINLTGSMFCCQAVGRYMAAAKSGVIINIGSVAGLIGRDRRMYHRTNKMEQPIEYAAAKGGVISYTRDLASYMAPYGVRVNSISPGGFDKGEPREFVSAYGDMTPLGRMGELGKELKAAALYLASDASSYVTGHNLVVDGGFSVWR